MASLLRQIVAGPRVRHADTGLDLCYVTENIIVTSGPTQTYPRKAYRTPLHRLTTFLNEQHGEDWAIWEFRAEGTGYPDEAVYGRILHYPWPDHHPPPFRLVPGIMASMRNWLRGGELRKGGVGAIGPANDSNDGQKTEVKKTDGGEAAKGEKGGRVVVVHCKAGKGRSGTMTCSYLISECGWSMADALQRFTERRMRPGFGEGVSIPSQRRWVRYVDRWAKTGGKRYVDREVEVVEIHVVGLREGVRIDVEGFEDEGKRMTRFHTFTEEERIVIDGPGAGAGGDGAGSGTASAAASDVESGRASESEAGGSGTESGGSSYSRVKKAKAKLRTSILFTQALAQNIRKGESLHGADRSPTSSSRSQLDTAGIEDKDAIALGSSGGANSDAASTKTDTPTLDGSHTPQAVGLSVILKPSSPIVLPTSDVKIAAERRSSTLTSMGGPTIVTSVGHFWFNAFFEGNGPELGEAGPEDSGVFEIAWDEMDGLKGLARVGPRGFDRMRVVWAARKGGREEVIREPGVEEEVREVRAADWRGGEAAAAEGVEEGIVAEVEGVVADVDATVEEGDRAAVKSSGPGGEEIGVEAQGPVEGVDATVEEKQRTGAESIEPAGKNIAGSAQGDGPKQVPQ